MMRHFLIVVVCAGFAATALAQPQERDSFGPGAPPQDGYAGPPPGGPGGPPPNAMFQAIDADGDGAITMRELRKAVVALKKLDVDKDGKITLAETTLHQNGPSGGGGPSDFRGQAGQGNGPGGFNGAAGDPRSGPNLMQYDRNGDGALSPEEVPTQMMGMVRGSDQNGNGKLDAQELEAIGQRMNERLRGQRSLPPGVTVGHQGVERRP